MKIKFLIFSLILMSIGCYAQTDRTFWFAVPKETYAHIPDPNPYVSPQSSPSSWGVSPVNNVSFKITALGLDAHVTVSMPKNAAFVTQNFTVPANQSYIDTLAVSFAQFFTIYDNTAPNGSRSVSDLPGAPENRGFLITSDNDITVYYDYDNYWNRELFVLKGQNSLGTEFYTPIQNIWGSDDNGMAAKFALEDPYCELDMVATVDNTQVTITPPVNATPIFNGYANNNPIVVTLNRGQSFSLVANSMVSSLHPTGTHIVSNQPIAVSQTDDSQMVAFAGCADTNGDQLVPVNIVGSKYLVMTGRLSQNVAPYNVPPIYNSPHNIQDGEQIFVLATQNNTIVSFYNKVGTLLYTTVPLNAGQEDYLSVNVGTAPYDTLQTSIYIQTNGPNIYVWHITCVSCEMGGAILPPITNCTGSTTVSFFRSATVDNIQLNLMVPYDTTQPFSSIDQSYNYFTLNYSDGTPPFKIPGSWFEPNIAAGWAVLKYGNRDFDAITHMGQAHTVVNTKDFFHLGMINGSPGVTNKYGYFSNYNIQRGGARVANTSTTNVIACLGDTIILSAEGGLSYIWSYGSPGGPPTYISNSTASNPQIYPPVGNTPFYVYIHRSKCFGDTTIQINTTVLAPVTADFETDQTVSCAPSTIQFTNQSIGNINNSWSYQENNNPVVDFTPINPNLFSQNLDNKTFPYAPINYKYTLVVDDNEGCSDQVSKIITVYPEINTDLTASDSIGCNPITIDFSAKNSGGDTLNWSWNFGDQGSSNITNPIHTFSDYSPDNKDTIYHVQLVATSPYYCNDTVRQNIHVYPFIQAGFTVDTVIGCSPVTIQVSNTSAGAISQYNWDFGDASSSNTNLSHFAHTYANITNNTQIFKFTLTVTNQFGCTDTISRFIKVYPQANASFTANVTEGCNPLTVSFTNLSNIVSTQFLWDFGDSSTSNNKTITHQFINNTTTDQVYKVMLTSITNSNCTSSDSTLITVHAFLNPSFTLSASAGCTPYTDTISNKSTGGIKTTPAPSGYTWNFGDGTISNDTMPSFTHIYKNTTSNVINTSVTLTLTDHSGSCTASLSRNVILYPEITANYSANTYSGCNPLAADFSNLSIPAAVATNFIWDFNDGSSSVLENPQHEFNNISSSDAFYQVKMTAISPDNCKDSVTKVITVYPFIEAGDAINKPTGCSPDTVTITNGSLGGITQYSWNYGDGTQDHNANPQFTHVYVNHTNAAQTLNLQLIVQNHIPFCQDTIDQSLIIYPEVVSNFSTQNNITEGCDSLNIIFINASGPTPVPTHYNWEFGDGGSSALENPIHLFVHPDPSSALSQAFTTKLYAYSQYNCSSVDSAVITVYPFIKADFSINQPEGCSPLTLTFNNSSSAGANNFLWVFGNGVINNNPTQTFTQTYQNLTGGTLTVNPTLTVTYNGNCPSSATQAIQVFPKVTADFSQDALQGCHPITIHFTNTSQNALLYQWNFGDLGISTLTNPSHAYTDYSTVDSVYRVMLLATSQYNCTDTISKQITIYPKPKARFNVANSISCPPFQLAISNLTEAGNTYLWNFGDGSDTTTNDLETVNHTYNNLQANTVSYTLLLSVTSAFNCTDSSSQNINVYPSVIAGFEPDTANCSDVLVQFRNQTQRGSTYFWNFGDRVTSNLAQPKHDFFNHGINDTTFNVSLVSYSSFGCVDSSSRTVTVYPQPVTAFSALPTYLNFPSSTVNVVNETNAGNWNYLWNFGDGITESVENPQTHTYVTWGHYNIELKSWSANCSDSAFTMITVIPPVPIAAFSMTPDVCLGLSITFTDKSVWANQWNWNFGDTTTSTDENPMPPHVYKYPGIYHVQLIVSGDGGTNVLTQNVEIYPLPEVGFTPQPTLVMLPNAEVRFYNNTQLGIKYLWNFGDNEQSTETEPFHTYQSVGQYTVSLDAWTANDCFDSAIMVNAVQVIGGGNIKFPNVFTPNPGGPNGGKCDPYAKPSSASDRTIFYPLIVPAGSVTQYHLEIYDRWGEKLFQSDDVTIGWDGYYQGSMCKGDVYVWMARGKYDTGQTFNMVGDVTLLK